MTCRLQQLAHNYMAKVTAITSHRLLFTSEVTKNEYIKFTNIKNKSNLFVIGNGIDLKRFDEGYNLSIDKLVNKKFILSVSQIYRLKNFDNCISNWSQQRNRESYS